MRESGFDKVIGELVSEGVIYVGGSAGAVVAGPTIEPVCVFDDPKAAANLTDFSGLHLVDFVILPHYGGDELHTRTHKEVIEKWTKKGYELVPLTNDQAITVLDKKWNIIDV